ncbi:hypothetical protein J2X85_000018 [Microbacterium trichothecenolyticum]|uniref:hypothetical protein n=1 Tax=Microbacterium trichothecenolyticum TaxID=69370 RepID=UPI002857ABB0|nr:hypothetical protein [Microbacterium trichothecenolyticum]MDR7182995.1 hypothetical protein [Microbacterium trichothecenolyticum]
MADVVPIDVSGHGRPRVTFTMFASDDDPVLHAWLRFRSLLVSSASHDVHQSARRGPAGESSRVDPRTDSGELGFWRLLASNNREIGRSFLLYRSFDKARAHVQALQGTPEALAGVYVAGPVHGSRGWVVTSDDAPIMTCSRWYESTSARAAAAAGALAALPAAQMSDLPDRSGPSGRFLRREAGNRAVRPPRRADGPELTDPHRRAERAV